MFVGLTSRSHQKTGACERLEKRFWLVLSNKHLWNSTCQEDTNQHAFCIQVGIYFPIPHSGAICIAFFCGSKKEGRLPHGTDFFIPSLPLTQTASSNSSAAFSVKGSWVRWFQQSGATRRQVRWTLKKWGANLDGKGMVKGWPFWSNLVMGVKHQQLECASMHVHRYRPLSLCVMLLTWDDLGHSDWPQPQYKMLATTEIQFM